MITTLLFDLDGTLIHMDQDPFLKAYFHHISDHFATLGYDKERFEKSMIQSVITMLQNDGKRLNCEVFWECFCALYGEDLTRDRDKFDNFYATDYELLREYCGPKPGVEIYLKKWKEMGLRLVLASNSVYPPVAYHKRMSWGDLTPAPFEMLTTYENMHYCKPSLGYFTEITEKLGVSPTECLMIGNDVSDDMPARHVGMQVFLLTDYLLNPKGEDVSALPQGDFAALAEYIEKNR
ncbi:MAG: HAD family hydrolase [Clostridia bacterium]|nr:HAD family hydrolase [Clostridia bacterium]